MQLNPGKLKNQTGLEEDTFYGQKRKHGGQMDIVEIHYVSGFGRGASLKISLNSQNNSVL